MKTLDNTTRRFVATLVIKLRAITNILSVKKARQACQANLTVLRLHKRQPSILAIQECILAPKLPSLTQFESCRSRLDGG